MILIGFGFVFIAKYTIKGSDKMQDRQIYIADTVHNTILLSNYEKEVISTQLFNRLHNISQNSTAYLTFPSNRTKRFEHSLGTMKLCGDIVSIVFLIVKIFCNKLY